MADSQRLILKVLAGPNAGAEAVVARRTSVGSGEAADIVLADPGLAAAHFTLLIQGASISVEVGDSPVFIKNEERLQKLSTRPSEIVRRQLRVTPYPHEDVGWIVANSGEEVCLFSSDFPHVEGGRNPLKRFNDSLADTAPRAVERFYCDNFIDLMGEGLAADLRHPKMQSAA